MYFTSSKLTPYISSARALDTLLAFTRSCGKATNGIGCTTSVSMRIWWLMRIPFISKSHGSLSRGKCRILYWCHCRNVRWASILVCYTKSSYIIDSLDFDFLNLDLMLLTISGVIVESHELRHTSKLMVKGRLSALDRKLSPVDNGWHGFVIGTYFNPFARR